jgi:cytochrome c oxidase assembly protein subunit 11
MRVQVGEYEAKYFARNDSDRAIVGSAVPSVAPARASGYFSKTECFCFTAQTLQPAKARDMPVRFIVDPAPAGRREDDHPVLHLLQERHLTARSARARAIAGVPLAAP